MLGEYTPNLNRLIADGFLARLGDGFPALTCPCSRHLDRHLPREHGIVANGWYFRDSPRSVSGSNPITWCGGEKVWDLAKTDRVRFPTASKLFWWYNMYAEVDYSVTLRPIYPADGRKIPALYSHPAELSTKYEANFGKFPMFNFWGPKARHPIQRVDSLMCNPGVRRPSSDAPAQLSPAPGLQSSAIGPDDPAIWKDVGRWIALSANH